MPISGQLPALFPLLGRFQQPHIPIRELEDCKRSLAAAPDQRLTTALGECLDWLLATRDILDTGDPKTAWLLDSLREQLGARGQGYAGIGQINTTPGDLAGNARKIMRYLSAGEAIGLDMVIFPELALMGYPIRDVIIRHPFLVRENMKWLQAIAERTGRTYALVGFVEPRLPQPGEQRIGKEYFNSLAVLGEGEIKALVRKSLLPTYTEFEDYRQFEPSPASGAHHPQTLTSAAWGFKQPTPDGNPYKIHRHTYGLSICEDTWNDTTFFESPLYRKDPMAELAAVKPQVLVNISASPTRSRKEFLKHNLLSAIARRHGIPYIYANQTGTVDEVSFDGASRVYDKEGRLLARARQFEEQFLIVNPFHAYDPAASPIYPLAGQSPEDRLEHPEPPPVQKVFDAYDESDLPRTYESLLQGIRDYFRKTGFRRAVIGLSGGLDSSVTAVLLADALGPENVTGISMPSDITPDANRNDARQLAENLGVHFMETPIGPTVASLAEAVAHLGPELNTAWGAADAGTNAGDNAQAITRATILRQVGNLYRAFPIATSDKSELYLGYATVNGDMSGALAPIGDLPKTKVRALARWLNKHRAVPNALPESVITKPSGADLKIDPATGRLVTAEEDLMPYEFADEIIWRIEALKQGKNDMMAATFQYEQTHGISAEQKKHWLDKFFDRMAKAVFKWFVSPPILIVEGNGSITKTDYHHPIVANRIVWDALDEAQIAALLEQCRWHDHAPSG